ncbi:MAG TPA: PKD domain-containing protein, partial [Acidobacteriota bacterium]
MKRFTKKHLSLIGVMMSLALLIMSCGDDDNNNNNPVTPQLQPTIAGMTPAQVSLGERVEGNITGTNLTGVTSVNLGDGVPVSQVESISANEIRVAFSVNRNAAAGERSITVVTSAGTATANGLLKIRNNSVPVADFTVSGGSKNKNQIISFSATARDDKKVESYRWEFGDGTGASGKEVTHKYAEAGVFTVELAVTDNQGAKGIATKGVTIQNNFAPVAKFSGPDEIEAGEAASFDGSASSDNDGRIIKYSWNFGDGKKGEGQKVTHIYSDDRTYNVTLTVTDNDNASGLIERKVRVNPREGGGGGPTTGSCALNKFGDNRGRVTSVDGNVITMDTSFRKCPACGEFRRDTEGIREFVGDVVRIDGNRYTLF